MTRLRLTPAILTGGGMFLALIVIAFAVMLVAIGNQRDTSVEVRQADERIALATELERRIIDLETGQRGFVITGERRFLEPRERALRMLPRLQEELIASERQDGDTEDVVLLSGLYRNLRSYVRDYSNPIVATAAEDLEAAAEIVADGEGRRRVGEMRRQVGSFIDAEAAEARAAGVDANRSSNTAVLLAVLGLVLVPLLVIGLIAFVSRRIAAPIRRAADAASRLRSGDLTARVEESGIGEVRSLAGAFNEMATSLQHSRDELEQQNAELEAQQAELEQGVDQLAEERDRIQRFHDFVSRLAEAPEIESLGAALLDEVTAEASADAATLYVLDTEGGGGRLRLVASRGFDPGLLAEAIERGHGLAGRAVLEEEVIRADHGETGLELPAFGQSIRVHHELHLPIGRAGSMLGVASLARLGEPRFGHEQEERLREMSGPAAVALSNALAREAIERAAALNDAVLESAHDAYVASDQDGIVVSWNRRAEAMFGYTREEAIGQSAAELIIPDDPDAREEHTERRQQIIASAENGKPVEGYEVWVRRQDGRRILIEVSAAAVLTGSGAIVSYFTRDVTDRAYREQEHAAAEAVSRALAEAEAGEGGRLILGIIAALGRCLGLPVGGFWELDPRERLVRCTRLWIDEDFEFPELRDYSRQIAYRPGEALPEFEVLKDAWDSENVQWDVPAASDLSEREKVAGSAGLRASLALPVHSGQQMLGVLTFGSRSAAPPDQVRIAALRAITDLIGQVVERRRAEQAAEQLKNEFFALVSHELRTPLISITGYLDIVRAEEAGDINEEQKRYLGVIDRNARRLMRLVGDLLFVAQVESGNLPLNKSEVELEAVAREAVEAARPRAEKQGVRLAAETEPVSIEAGDRDRIGQLVDNLISNAIKFTPEGGSVTVRVANGDARARVEVSDTGMGISDADQENLFERFYRTEDAAKLAIPGIGLGLSISKAIAEGHGGTIAVRSREGEGTTFSVELPVNGDRAAQANGLARR